MLQEDPKSPTNVPEILQAIDMVNEITTFHGKLGMQLQKKLKIFREMEGHAMPEILDDKGELKDLVKWKDELGYFLP